MLVKLSQRVLGDGPEVVVEDHLAEDGVTSEEPADVSVVTVTPSQEDHIWLTLNGGSEKIKEKLYRKKITKKLGTQSENRSEHP